MSFYRTYWRNEKNKNIYLLPVPFFYPPVEEYSSENYTYISNHLKYLQDTFSKQQEYSIKIYYMWLIFMDFWSSGKHSKAACFSKVFCSFLD